MKILKINYLFILIIFITGCSSVPKNTANSCSIFDEKYLWYKHTKNVIGIDTFGESGKGNQLMDHFGFTPSKIAKKISELV